MIIVITGGSSSGKSAVAEDIMNKREFGKKLYIATMEIKEGDMDGQRRIAKHRERRKNSNYKTIEKGKNLHEISVHEMDGSKSALLECVSNLTANVMFGKTVLSSDETIMEVLKEVRDLSGKLDNLVIVTNNVFDDIDNKDDMTLSYVKALGEINQELVKMADEAYEVVVGIPVRIK